MSEGVYLSRGKPTSQIMAERAEKERLDTKHLSVSFPLGLASDAMERMRDREDLLLDVSMSLAFLEEVLTFEGMGGSNAELSSLLGLIKKAIEAVTEKGEPAIRQTEAAIRTAIAGARKEGRNQC